MRKSLKKKISLIMIIMLLGLVITGCLENKPNALTQAEKIEDFEYMFKVIEENYPFLEVNKRVNDVDWVGKKEEFLKEVKSSKNDEAFFYKLSDILEQLNNGHTHIVGKKYYEYLFPIYNNIKGAEPWVEELSKPKTLERYDFNIDNEENKSFSGMSEEFLLEDNVETKIIDDNIAYMKIKSFSNYNVVADNERIKGFINEIKPLDALIIDIRGNGGGSRNFWVTSIVESLIEKSLKTDYYFFTRGGEFTEKFYDSSSRFQIGRTERLKGLTELPPEVFTDFKYYIRETTYIEPYDSINFKGKIFLLVDKGVYSASETFAVFAKETGFATLIGERTGGDGVLMSLAFCSLPKSGLVFRFAKELGTTESGVCNEEFKTVPHYIVDAEITENIEDDKCIQKAIELVKE